jgi:hypothetical protein
MLSSTSCYCYYYQRAYKLKRVENVNKHSWKLQNEDKHYSSTVVVDQQEEENELKVIEEGPDQE